MTAEAKTPELKRLIHRALAGDFVGVFMATEQFAKIDKLAADIAELFAAEPQSPALDVEVDLEGLEPFGQYVELDDGTPLFRKWGDPFPPTPQGYKAWPLYAKDRVDALLSEVRALRGANERMARLGRAIERERDEALAELSALRSLVEDEKREEASCADTCADGSLPVLKPDALPDDGLAGRVEEVRADFDVADLKRLAVNVRHSPGSLPTDLRRTAARALLAIQHILTPDQGEA
jgi:hypothetical protein